jgi:hypothetical protein
VEIIPSGQGCAAARLFLSLFRMEKVWETTFMALRSIAAAAACVRFEPERITANFESRAPENPKLKEFLETNLNRKFFNRPASPGNFFRLTPAALNYHPELDVPGAKHISTDTK